MASGHPALLIGCAAVLGLVIGSFLNVVAYRVPRHESVVHPPSRCPACGTQLKAADNVPVLSWLVLRGRCRYCRAPISPRYPLVEAATAASFALTAWALGPTWQLVPFAALGAAVVVTVAVDIDGFEVPGAVLVVFGAAVALNTGLTAAQGDWWTLGRAALFGALSAAGAEAAAVASGEPGGRWRVGGGTAGAVVAGALGWCGGWLSVAGGLAVAAGMWTAAVPWRWAGAGAPGPAPDGTAHPRRRSGCAPRWLVVSLCYGAVLVAAGLR